MIYTATTQYAYFSEDLADALNAVAVDAARVELDQHTVDLVLAWLARRWHLTVTPLTAGLSDGVR